jgi:hypothetical protein
MMQPPYDKGKVGRFFALGGEHLVYRYGSGQLIKLPFALRYFIDKKHHCANVRRGYDLYQKYFKDSFLSTELTFYEDGEYVIIQKLLPARVLHKSDLKDGSVARDFGRLISISREMAEKERLVPDFFGGWRLLFSGVMQTVGNILIEHDTKRLILIDFGVFGVAEMESKNTLVRFIERWAIRKQERLFKDFLG